MRAPWLTPLPLVAILRGLTPDEAVAIGQSLVESGFRVLEVPLNSPRPFESIALLQQAFGDRCLIGAGTVRTLKDIEGVAAAGGRLIVMPHADRAIVSAAKQAGMRCTPGVATPTEAFAAIDAGADALKLFPAEQLGTAALKAWRSVLPADVPLLPVGGITPESMAAYVAAGAHGFGIGSALYAPGRSSEDTGRRAQAFAEAWRAATPEGSSA